MGINSHALSPNVFTEMVKLVPEGSTVLEIGTGIGTTQLAEHYEVISIEDNPKWHTGHSELIHAPLIECKDLNLPRSFWKRFHEATRWYDPIVIEEALRNKNYDAIIYDGPAGGSSRAAMWYYYDKLFDTSVPVIVDDVHRRYDWSVATQIAREKKIKSFSVVMGDDSDHNMFAVIS